MILHVYEENITPREDISDERSYDTKLLLRGSESDTSLTFPFFFFYSRPQSRRAKENAVENIRFPQETGKFSSLKIDRFLKAFGT